MADIAALLGYQPSTLYADVKRLGLTPRRPSQREPDVAARRANVAQRVRDGLTAYEIAPALGVPLYTVRSSIFQLRLDGALPPKVPKVRPWAAHRARLQALADQGQRLRAIGAELGVNHETVRNWLHRSGIRPRSAP